MTTQEQYIERLKGMVEIKFGRGVATAEDCKALKEAVVELTDISLDCASYESLYLSGSGTPIRPLILTALARYVGYESWSSFCSSADVKPAEDSDIIPTPRYWGVVILTVLAIVIVAVTAFLLLDDGGKSEATSAQLSEVVASVESRWIARTVEECNTIRAYAWDENYAELVDIFIEEYRASLVENISKELAGNFEQRNIDVSDDKLSSNAEQIALSCMAMCEALETEIISVEN